MWFYKKKQMKKFFRMPLIVSMLVFTMGTNSLALTGTGIADSEDTASFFVTEVDEACGEPELSGNRNGTDVYPDPPVIQESEDSPLLEDSGNAGAGDSNTSDSMKEMEAVERSEAFLPFSDPAPDSDTDLDIRFPSTNALSFRTYVEDDIGIEEFALSILIGVPTSGLGGTEVAIPMEDALEYFQYSHAAIEGTVNVASVQYDDLEKEIVITLKEEVSTASETVILYFNYLKESAAVSPGTVLWEEVNAYVRIDGTATGTETSTGPVVTTARTNLSSIWTKMMPEDNSALADGLNTARVRIANNFAHHSDLDYPVKVSWDFPAGTTFLSAGNYEVDGHVITLTIESPDQWSNSAGGVFIQDDINFYLPENYSEDEYVIARSIECSYIDGEPGRITGEASILYSVTYTPEWKFDFRQYHADGATKAIADSREGSSRSINFVGAFGPSTYNHILAMQNSGKADITGVAATLYHSGDNGSQRLNFSRVQLYATIEDSDLYERNHWSYYFEIKDENSGLSTSTDVVHLNPSSSSVDPNSTSAVYWNLTLPALGPGQYIDKIHLVPTGRDGAEDGVLIEKNGFGLRYYFQYWDNECWPDGTFMPDYTSVKMEWTVLYDDAQGYPQSQDGTPFDCVYARDGIYAQAYLINSDPSGTSVMPGGTLDYQIQGYNLNTYAVAPWVNPEIYIKIPAELTLSPDFQTQIQVSGSGNYDVEWLQQFSGVAYNIYVLKPADGQTVEIARRAESSGPAFTIPLTFQVDESTRYGTRDDMRVVLTSAEDRQSGSRNFNMADGSTFDESLGAVHAPVIKNVPADENLVHYSLKSVDPAIFITEGHSPYTVASNVQFEGVVETKTDRDQAWQRSREISVSAGDSVIYVKLSIVNTGNTAADDISMYSKIPCIGDEAGTTVNGVKVSESMFETYVNAELEYWKWALTDQVQAELPSVKSIQEDGEVAQLKQLLQDLQPGLALSDSAWRMGDLNDHAGLSADEVTASFFFYRGKGADGILLPGKEAYVIFEMQIPDLSENVDDKIGVQFAFTGSDEKEEKTFYFLSDEYIITANTFTLSYEGNSPMESMEVENVPKTETYDMIGMPPEVTVSEDIPALNGYVFLHWSENKDGSGKTYAPGDLLDPQPTTGGRLTLYAQWEQDAEVKYSVYFYDGSSLVLQYNDIAFGDYLARPTDYESTHPSVEYWRTLSGEPWDFETDTMPNEDLRLYAVHRQQPDPEPDPDTYTLSYESNGGTAIPFIQLEEDQLLVEPSSEPTRTGYTFDGWYHDDGSFLVPVIFGADRMPAQDKTIYAKWVENDPGPGPDPDTYTLSYESNGGSAIPFIQLEEDQLLVEPSSEPTRTGYTFDGWYHDDGSFLVPVIFGADRMPAQDKTIYAKWIENDPGPDPETYTLSYESNGGSAIPSIRLEEDELLTEPDTEPTRTGYSFDGWHHDDDSFLVPVIFGADRMPAQDKTIYAKWLEDKTDPGPGPNPETYSVTYYRNGDIIRIDTGITAGQPLPNPPEITVSGYTFLGWTLYEDQVSDENAVLWNFERDRMPERNLDLYAVLIADGNVGGGTTGSRRSATLTVEGISEGRTIYSRTESVTSRIGQTITITAPRIAGYLLDDDEVKTITITRGANTVTFHYVVDTDGEPVATLNRDEYIWYLVGYPDNTVGPERNITRAEAAAVFYRLIVDDNKEAAVNSAFPDVNENAWYQHEVNYLAAKGVVYGDSHGNFRPEDTITRAELTAIAARCNLPSQGEINFSDVSMDHWGIAQIESAYNSGWISGYPDGTFQPDGPITRAEVVTILNRALERETLLADLPTGVHTYTDIDRTHWAYTDIMEASHSHTNEIVAGGQSVWKQFEYPII